MKDNPVAFIMEQINLHLPEGVRPLKESVEDKIKKGLESQFKTFNLVSRTEWEAQLLRLKAAEEKIALLEARLVQKEDKD